MQKSPSREANRFSVKKFPAFLGRESSWEIPPEKSRREQGFSVKWMEMDHNFVQRALASLKLGRPPFSVTHSCWCIFRR
jgi:hypothetical protein